MKPEPAPRKVEGATMSEARVAPARALLVGELAALADASSLAEALDIRRASVEEAHRALAGDPPDVMFLDGMLPAEALARVLEAAGPPGEGARPVLFVLTDEGRRTHVDVRLVEYADDFVNRSLGGEVLLARVRKALGMRSCLQELSRKHAELESLYTRMEGLAGRMADELRLAAKLQRSLLPPPLQHPRLEVAREFIPFREIGGDYYDLVPAGEQRLAFAIGDVMGKGVPAALLAANLKACLRAQLQGGDVPAEQVVARVNRLFWDVTPKGLFATLFFGIFDLEHRRLDYVNAGHDHPFVVIADGGIRELSTGGTVLGLVEGSSYDCGQMALQRGDVLVFYSDGVTDRENCRGEAYGLERLKEATLRSRGDAARIALYSLLGEVQGWAEGAASEDDMTLVVAKVL